MRRNFLKKALVCALSGVMAITICALPSIKSNAYYVTSTNIQKYKGEREEWKDYLDENFWIMKEDYSFLGIDTKNEQVIREKISGMSEFHIKTADQFMTAINMKGMTTKTIILDNDIDFKDKLFIRQGDFQGILDGNNHKLKNITFANLKERYYDFGLEYGDIGMFKSIDDGAVIKNLTFENINTFALYYNFCTFDSFTIAKRNDGAIIDCHIERGSGDCGALDCVEEVAKKQECSDYVVKSGLFSDTRNSSAYTYGSSSGLVKENYGYIVGCTVDMDLYSNDKYNNGEVFGICANDSNGYIINCSYTGKLSAVTACGLTGSAGHVESCISNAKYDDVCETKTVILKTNSNVSNVYHDTAELSVLSGVTFVENLKSVNALSGISENVWTYEEGKLPAVKRNLTASDYGISKKLNLSTAVFEAFGEKYNAIIDNELGCIYISLPYFLYTSKDDYEKYLKSASKLIIDGTDVTEYVSWNYSGDPYSVTFVNDEEGNTNYRIVIANYLDNATYMGVTLDFSNCIDNVSVGTNDYENEKVYLDFYFLEGNDGKLDMNSNEIIAAWYEQGMQMGYALDSYDDTNPTIKLNAFPNNNEAGLWMSTYMKIGDKTYPVVIERIKSTSLERDYEVTMGSELDWADDETAEEFARLYGSTGLDSEDTRDEVIQDSKNEIKKASFDSIEFKSSNGSDIKSSISQGALMIMFYTMENELPITFTLKSEIDPSNRTYDSKTGASTNNYKTTFVASYDKEQNKYNDASYQVSYAKYADLLVKLSADTVDTCLCKKHASWQMNEDGSGKLVCNICGNVIDSKEAEKATDDSKDEQDDTSGQAELVIEKKGASIKDAKGTKYKVTKPGSLSSDKAKVTGAEVAYTGPSSKAKGQVTVPDTVKINGVSYKVTSISANAFKNKKNITQITIGKNVKSIGKNTFAGCKKLKKLIVKTTKLTKKTVAKGAFKGIPKKVTIKVPKKKLKAYKKLFKSKGLSKKW